MKTYDYFVDIMDTQGEVIRIHTGTIDAKDAQQANRLAEKEFELKNPLPNDYYIWEITEEDAI